MLRRRTWRWLRIRIEQLFTVPPVLMPGVDRVIVVQQTRIGQAIQRG